MNENIKISKSFTVKDWINLRPKLLFSDTNWHEAVKVFEDRIQSRFLGPIAVIKSNDKNEGEGFSVTLISVVLLEFLAAFESGKIYTVHDKNKSPEKYNSGAKLLKSFLQQSDIFSHHFNSNSKIENFYERVRCGLVHEARTLKNDVIISSTSIKNTNHESIYFSVDGENRLNRDLLLEKLNEHINSYKVKLLSNSTQNKKNFLLKMDEISGLKHIWYFIYGSNLSEEQLVVRLEDISELYLLKHKCSLEGYQFLYNKKSTDGTAKANLIRNGESVVQGVAVLILEAKLDEFIAKYEKGYEKHSVVIDYYCEAQENNHYRFNAITCISSYITNSAPSEQYVAKVISGARENGFSEDYISSNLEFKS